MIHEIEIKEIVLYDLPADVRETIAEELSRGIAESVANDLTAVNGSIEREVVDAGSFSFHGGSARELTSGIAAAVARAVSAGAATPSEANASHCLPAAGLERP